MLCPLGAHNKAGGSVGDCGVTLDAASSDIEYLMLETNCSKGFAIVFDDLLKTVVPCSQFRTLKARALTNTGTNCIVGGSELTGPPIDGRRLPQ